MIEPPVDRELRSTPLRWTLHVGLPLSVSLLLHATLFALLALTTWHVLDPRDRAAGDIEASLRDVGGDPSQSFGWSTESLLPSTDLPPSVEATPRFDVSALTRQGDAQASTGEQAGNDGGGFGLGEIGRSGVVGLGGGMGEAGGQGGGEGFGSGGGVGTAGVWDLRVAGDKFAYVVDFSGSIKVVVDDLRRELKRSVGRLKPTQQFNVFIFYSTESGKDRFVTDSFAADLQPARPDVKRRFFEWIDRQVPTGSTDPRQAMRRALQLKPDAVFFLSDGIFEDRIVEDVRQYNRGVRIRIHGLVFDELLLEDVSGIPRLTEGAHRMKRIAEESGGKTKIVTGSDIRR
jgi:hypothetical protein